MKSPSTPGRRSPYHGAIQILRYNWPWYALGAGFTAAAAALSLSGQLAGIPLLPLGVAVAAADYWLASSVIASHWIYDRSLIATGGWMKGLLPAGCEAIGIFHAGLDESSEFIGKQFPHASLQIFDFFDAAVMSEPSIARARALRPGLSSVPARFDRLPPGDSSLDAGFVVFSAHELRKPGPMASFFIELRRCLGPRGELIVVEHVRDNWNFLAFGPGAFHFLPRKRWLAAFSAAGFSVRKEFAVTPFVTVFKLGSAT
jgi:SAM-dependent methyltransferase